GRMHVDAVGAAVDLRGADLDEFHQARLEAGGDRERRAGPHLHDVGGGGEEINLSSHWTIPFVSSNDMTSPGPSIVTSRRKKLRRSDSVHRSKSGGDDRDRAASRVRFAPKS